MTDAPLNATEVVERLRERFEAGLAVTRPCTVCGLPTPFLGSRLCDRHWIDALAAASHNELPPTAE